LLSVLGEQPLGPAGGTPPAPQQGQDVNQSQAPQPQQGPMQPPNQPPAPPGQPPLPTVPANTLANPALQQQAMDNVK
jgi:hypothetical protein